MTAAFSDDGLRPPTGKLPDCELCNHASHRGKCGHQLTRTRCNCRGKRRTTLLTLLRRARQQESR